MKAVAASSSKKSSRKSTAVATQRNESSATKSPSPQPSSPTATTTSPPASSIANPQAASGTQQPSLHSPTTSGQPSSPSTSSAHGHFTIEAWIDHFDTWVDDLAKRLNAQPVPSEPTQHTAPQDIPLALRIGANHLKATASRAKGADAKRLQSEAARLESLAAANLPFYDSPITDDLIALAAKYPDLAYATKYPIDLPLWVDRERAIYSSWYELFPRSTSPIPGKHGTLRDVETRLPEIAAMGFDVLYLPPIHPIGKAFRKGPNNSVTAAPGDEGSPWAIGSAEGGHTAIHPKLGTFADFDHLQTATRDHGMELALDIAFQCSPDHPWVAEHPDWFTLRPDGTIQYAENPPKKYQDIYPLNFESSDWRGLWEALYGVFKFWVDRGVRIFRVDNPHTKALPFWEWCIAEIQKHAPETLFLAEAFTRPHVMYSLAKAGYTQSYTYFTWRTDKPSLQAYMEELTQPPVSDFFRPNLWPNTPDILHAQLQIEDPIERRAVFHAASHPRRHPLLQLRHLRPSLRALRRSSCETSLWQNEQRRISRQREVRNPPMEPQRIRSPSLRSSRNSTKSVSQTPRCSATKTSTSTQ